MTPQRLLSSLCPVLVTLVLLSGCSAGGESETPLAGDPSPMDSLVSVEWLSEHLDDPDLVVLDCSVVIEPDGQGGFRAVNGRPSYEAGHIPTAGFADLKGALSDATAEIGYAVPAPEDFAAAMGSLGVGDDTRVVLYDSMGLPWAARVWWMLRWIGFDNVAILDGGIDAWTDAGYELSTEAADEPVRTLTVNLRPELIVDKEAVHAAIRDDSVELIDALSEPQYRGDIVMYNRPGHIPTASNVPSMSLVDESGHVKPQEELASLFEGDREKRTITYCGGGIAASADAFVMTRLGFKDVAVYTASLQEWSADPENPMVSGPEPGAAPE